MIKSAFIPDTFRPLFRSSSLNSTFDAGYLSLFSSSDDTFLAGDGAFFSFLLGIVAAVGDLGAFSDGGGHGMSKFG